MGVADSRKLIPAQDTCSTNPATNGHKIRTRHVLTLGIVPNSHDLFIPPCQTVLQTKRLGFCKPDAGDDGRNNCLQFQGPWRLLLWRFLAPLQKDLHSPTSFAETRILFTSLRESELRLCVQGIYEQAKQGNSAINVREHISKLTCNIMWLIVAGRRYTNEELVAENLTMGKLFDEVLSLSSVASIGDFIPRLKWLDLQGNMRRLKSLHKALDGFLEVVLDDHLNKDSSTIDTKDFVDVLMDIQREGDTSEFDRSNVKALVMDMVVGGSESTATAIEWAMSLLLKNPHTLKRLQEEIDMVIGGNEIVKEEDLHKLKYLQCVVKESLRLYPPFPLGGPHMSMEDATVCGYDVPKGSLLMLNLWAIGRDENVWEDAEEFRPERFIGEESVDILGVGDMMLLPFSTGRRGCPGSNLAIPIILLSIATFVKCFEWRVEGEIDMTEKFGLSIPRKYPLMVVPSMRVPWM